MIEVYLMFNGRCEEAIQFYQETVGARLEMLMRFKEAPEPPPPGMVPEGWGDKVMHASLRIGDTRVMASDDGTNAGGFSGFSLSLTVPTQVDATKAFTKLSEGGNVTMPLDKTFWSPCFGMLQDKFGVVWMVTTAT